MLDTVTMLDRAPAGVRRLAYRIAAGRGVLGRLADTARYRFSERDLPQLPPASDATVRLLIGPANSAGQGYRWARSAERYLPDVTAVAMKGIGSDPFRPDVDLRVPVAVYQRSSSWHAIFEEYLAGLTHVIWESALPLLGRRHDSDALREIVRLKDRGVRGALMFHGSDIRPPARHAAESEWSPFSGVTGPTRALSDTAERNAELAAASGVPVFVSTPDLLRWLPDATWCPVVIDPSLWRQTAMSRSALGPPVVAHAPSQKWMKGTTLIEPMLRRLSEEGVIEYRQVVGVAHASMPAFYASADIVLDQFLVGSYGVTACEAMAAGKLVMGHVDEFTRDQVVERAGLELPIHEATVDSLETELRRVAADTHAFESVRRAGPDFVAAVHEGRRSASALAPFLGAGVT